VFLSYILIFINVNRKGKHKDRNPKKEETEKAAEMEQPDIELESKDAVEDVQPAEEENIYISDEEEEKRRFYVAFLHFLSTIRFIVGTCR